MKLAFNLFLCLIFLSSVQAQVTTKMEIEYNPITAGEHLLAQVNIFGRGEENVHDFNVFYFLKDEDGNIINQGSRTIALQIQTSIVVNLGTAQNTPPGEYLFQIEVRELKTNELLATASEMISITKYQKTVNEDMITFAVYGIIIGIIILVFILLWQHREWHVIKEKERFSFNEMRKRK